MLAVAARDGTPMMEGGGTLVVEGAEADLLVFHAYDAATGRPTLQISTMAWPDGWPRVGRLK